MISKRGVLVTPTLEVNKIVQKKPVKAQTNGTNFNWVTMKHS